MFSLTAHLLVFYGIFQDFLQHKLLCDDDQNKYIVWIEVIEKRGASVQDRDNDRTFKQNEITRSKRRRINVVENISYDSELFLAQRSDTVGNPTEYTMKNYVGPVPEYPTRCKKHGIEGLIKLKIRISAQGKVIQVSTLTGVDSCPEFIENTREAMKLGYFNNLPHINDSRSPAMSGGNEVDLIVPVRFQLKE